MKKIRISAVLILAALLFCQQSYASELLRKRATATTISFPLINSTGAEIANATGAVAQYSFWNESGIPTNFTNIADSVIQIGPYSGRYYLNLSAAEMTKDYLYVKINSTGNLDQDILIRTMTGAPLNISTTDDGGTINVTNGILDTVTAVTNAVTITSNGDITAINNTLQAANNTLANTGFGLAALNATLTKTNTTATQANTTVGQANATVTQANNTLAAANTNITNTNNNATAANNTLSNTGFGLSALNGTVTKTNTTVTIANTTLTVNNNTVAAMNTNVTTVNTVVGQANTTITQANNTLANAGYGMAALNVTLTACNNTANAYNLTWTTTKAGFLDIAVSSRANGTEYNATRAAKLDYLDDEITSRMATFTYTPPDNAGIAAINQTVANINSTLPALNATANAINNTIDQTNATVALANQTAKGIKDKTDSLTFTTANKVDARAFTVDDKSGYSISGTKTTLDALNDPSLSGIWGYVTRSLTDKDGFNLTNNQSSVTIGTVNSVTNGVIVTTNNDKAGYSISGIKQTLDALNDLSAAQVWSNATRSLTDKANFTLANSVLGDIWNYTNRTLTLSSSPTADAIAIAVWDKNLITFNTSDTAGKKLKEMPTPYDISP